MSPATVPRIVPPKRLRNSRKTERGAKQFPIAPVVRAAPFAHLSRRAACVLNGVACMLNSDAA